jgi:hypothetical protein
MIDRNAFHRTPLVIIDGKALASIEATIAAAASAGLVYLAPLSID